MIKNKIRCKHQMRCNIFEENAHNIYYKRYEEKIFEELEGVILP